VPVLVKSLTIEFDMLVLEEVEPEVVVVDDVVLLIVTDPEVGVEL